MEDENKNNENKEESTIDNMKDSKFSINIRSDLIKAEQKKQELEIQLKEDKKEKKFETEKNKKEGKKKEEHQMEEESNSNSMRSRINFFENKDRPKKDKSAIINSQVSYPKDK